MGEDMERWFVCPPRFQIIGLILGESAVVQNAEFRVGSRIFQRIRLTAIVEACPIEEACTPRTLGIEFPPTLDAVLSTVGVRTEVHGSHVSRPFWRIEIDTTRSTARGLFRTHNSP